MKNKLLLITGIVVFVLILNINLIFAANTKYYQLNFNYNAANQQLKLNSVILKTTTGAVDYYEKEFPYENLYDLRILDSRNKVLNSGIFYTCNDFYIYDTINADSAEIDDGGVGCTDKKSFTINVPYNKNAKYISVLNPNNKKIIRYTLKSGGLPSLSIENNYLYLIAGLIIIVLLAILIFFKHKTKKKRQK